MKPMFVSLLALSFLPTAPLLAQAVVYVNDDATGANDGSSWVDAYTDLQSALDAAEASQEAITEIWVASGIYLPSKRTDPDDPRSATFAMINGVSMYGGFAGTETAIDERDIEANPTILSGDLNGDDGPDFADFDENSWHVVVANNIQPGTEFSGFDVTGGNANGEQYGKERGGALRLVDGWPTMDRCDFVRNFAGIDFSNTAHAYGGGGAVSIEYSTRWDSFPNVGFRNCRFISNKTVGYGGGLFLFLGGVELDGCLFQENEARLGGGMASEESNGMTIRSCRFEGNIAESAGGGLFGHGGYLNITESEFRFNECGSFGGGVSANTSFSPEVSNSRFFGNRAETGGAISVPFGAVVRECEFRDNGAWAEGGAIYCAGETTVNRCEFDQNWAMSDGGAIFSTSQALLSSCTFSNNSAALGGGVATLSGSLRAVDCRFDRNFSSLGGAVHSEKSSTLIERCEVTGNSAQVGGGVVVTYGEAQIIGSLIAGNYASLYAGGIADGSERLLFENCTIVHNHADSLGGGIIAEDGSQISNSILWGNSVGLGSDSSSQVDAQIERSELTELRYSVVEGWTADLGGIGVSAENPQFVAPEDPDSWWGPLTTDYRLRRVSPFRNTGSKEFLCDLERDPPPARLDLDGKPRVLCQQVDIGAYEFGVAGDADCDLDFDAPDFANWSTCAGGPGETSDCLDFDADGDRDLDLADLARLLPTFVPWNPPE